MDTKFQTSFIPKRPIVAGTNAAISVKQPFNLISVASTVIFVLVILATAGVFGYEKYLNQQIDQMGQELVAAKSAFETELFTEFIRLDTRINTAKSLLDKHVAVSLFFDSLQNLTLKSVQFKSLDYKMDDAGNVDLLMKGEATSYNALALQSELFEGNKYITSADFSDIDLNEKGNVIFSLKIGLDTDLVAYHNGLQALSFMYDMNQSNAQ